MSEKKKKKEKKKRRKNSTFKNRQFFQICILKKWIYKYNIDEIKKLWFYNIQKIINK